MCGIIGISSAGNDAALRRGLSLLGHRGPDDNGIFQGGTVALGHARLSIIDLSPLGHQPMKGQSAVITFNGEIYNYAELKKELLSAGVQFTGGSDTEVIVRGYEQSGISFFEKLRGMWAFAIYDEQKDLLILSRDHFGIKPLYYSTQNNTLSFASEIKALAELAPKMTPNTDAYADYFNLGYFIGKDTCFKEIKKLNPGEVLIWNLSAKNATCHQLTLAQTTEEKLTTPEAAVSFIDKTLQESVAAHYVADVEVGLLLSGGTDSSLLAALSKQIGKNPVCYHVAIPGSVDTEYARDIAAHLGFRLEERELTNSSLRQGYDELRGYIDMPTSDVSIIPTALVYKAINKDSKVVLSGEGGDELFGGYLRHGLLQGLSGVSAKASPFHTMLSRLYSTSDLGMRFLNPLLRRLQNISDRKVNDVVGVYLEQSKTLGFPLDEMKVRNHLTALYENHPYRSLTPANLFFDMWMYLPDSLLYKNDIASMASSIEARVPLVDRAVAAAAAALPPTFRFSSEYSGKKILKDVLRKYIPDSMIDRPKKGFGFSFDMFDADFFRDDYKKAAYFHRTHAADFGISPALAELLQDNHSETVCKKFPRFAFSLITNHMVMQKYWH